jgi:N-alpha-acetyltransferase 38, NatC auxiliary subunit
MAKYDISSTLLEKTCLVHISDGRAFKGTFICVDSARNLLLSNATEYKAKAQGTGGHASLQGGAEAQYEKRFVGLVMVPGLHLAKLEVQAGFSGPASGRTGRPPADLSMYI